MPQDFQRRLLVANGRPLDRVEHLVGHQVVFVGLARLLGAQFGGRLLAVDRAREPASGLPIRPVRRFPSTAASGAETPCRCRRSGTARRTCRRPSWRSRPPPPSDCWSTAAARRAGWPASRRSGRGAGLNVLQRQVVLFPGQRPADGAPRSARCSPGPARPRPIRRNWPPAPRRRPAAACGSSSNCCASPGRRRSAGDRPAFAPMVSAGQSSGM